MEFPSSPPWKASAPAPAASVPNAGFLEGNPYFSAGFGLGILGTGMAALRGASTAAVSVARATCRPLVTSKDACRGCCNG